MAVLEKARVTQNVPVAYEEALAAEALEMKKRVGAVGGDYIGVNRDKTFRLPGGEASPAVAGFIVGFVAINQFYKGKYDPKNLAGPVCAAAGQNIADLRPFEKAPEKQNADCHTCWANQWGSDGKGKACKNQRQLALIAPDAQADGPIMLLKVSPTGTTFWDAYALEVTAAAGALIKVVTMVTFDPKEDYPSLRFKLQGPNENWQTAFGRRAAAMERLLAEPDFVPVVVADKPKA